mmetsp:Transcript_36735/g.97845  ORF Transcript_36735/g.97845 Transcript_36735/m.97845 type:complete len:229 (-) Transcript_36735:183-869(-)
MSPAHAIQDLATLVQGHHARMQDVLFLKLLRRVLLAQEVEDAVSRQTELIANELRLDGRQHDVPCGVPLHGPLSLLGALAFSLVHDGLQASHLHHTFPHDAILVCRQQLQDLPQLLASLLLVEACGNGTTDLHELLNLGQVQVINIHTVVPLGWRDPFQQGCEHLCGVAVHPLFDQSHEKVLAQTQIKRPSIVSVHSVLGVHLHLLRLATLWWIAIGTVVILLGYFRI